MGPTEKGLRGDVGRACRRGDIRGWLVASQVYADWLEEHGQDERAARRRRLVATRRVLGLRWPRPRHLDGLGDHQRQQLAMALSRPVGLLVGTPGTGKTHCAVSLIRALVPRPRPGAGDVAVCAPTGKAAVRINQHLGSPVACTIHQLLEVSRNGHDGEGWGFLRNARQPLDARYVVVDEASMLDTDLAAALFAACQPGTHVLLVGDPNQLPPVGHGAPLRDMIAAGVPCGRLSEIRRNAGRIAEACAAIQAGEPWEPAAAFAPSRGENLTHCECSTPAEQLVALGQVLATLRGSHNPAGVQVLAAVNTRGELSRANLNRLMQEQLNPTPMVTDVEPSGPWRLNDKVVCLRNYWAGGTHSRGGTCYVANGDMGRVTSFQGGAAVVQLSAPSRLVLAHAQAPHGLSPRGAGAAGVSDWDLAYALTAHKAQGSEWPVVILMIDANPAARHVCTREWVYTALSRGKERVITIGRLGVLKQMCARVSMDRRKTFLAEDLTG